MTPLSPDEARILAVTCASVRASVAAGVAVLSPEAAQWLDVAERGAAGVLALACAVEAEREECAQIASREASAWLTGERPRVTPRLAGLGAAETIAAAIRARRHADIAERDAVEAEAKAARLRDVAGKVKR